MWWSSKPKGKDNSATISIRAMWDRTEFRVRNSCAKSSIYVQIYERTQSMHMDETHFKVAVNAVMPFVSGGVEVEYDNKKEYIVETAKSCNLLHSGHVAGRGLQPDDERRSCTFPIEEKVKVYLLVIRKADDRHIVRSLSYKHNAFQVKDKHFHDEDDGGHDQSRLQRLYQNLAGSTPRSPRASSSRSAKLEEPQPAQSTTLEVSCSDSAKPLMLPDCVVSPPSTKSTVTENTPFGSFSGKPLTVQGRRILTTEASVVEYGPFSPAPKSSGTAAIEDSPFPSSSAKPAALCGEKVGGTPGPVPALNQRRK